MSKVTVTPIRTRQDYERAQARISELLNISPEPYSDLDDELDVLTTLVHAYEQEYYPISLPDPVDAIKLLMEENSWKNKDLEQFLGPKSRVSEILNRKRYFTLQQIYNLHKHLGLPLEMFFNEKALKAAA